MEYSNVSIASGRDLGSQHLYRAKMRPFAMSWSLTICRSRKCSYAKLVRLVLCSLCCSDHVHVVLLHTLLITRGITPGNATLGGFCEVCHVLRAAQLASGSCRVSRHLSDLSRCVLRPLSCTSVPVYASLASHESGTNLVVWLHQINHLLRAEDSTCRNDSHIGRPGFNFLARPRFQGLP